jgi:phospholipid/cholesterol/gamma-HCH transport system substrate-binding protein
LSTIFNIRKLRLPRLSRITVMVALIALVSATVAGVLGWPLYRGLTTKTVTAYFESATALYRGDKVTINGIRVGSVDDIEPVDGMMKVTLRYDSQYNVPAEATAVILNPSLVASRVVQLSPGYTGGPVLPDGAAIPLERTQVPAEWDELRDQVDKLVTELGPTPDQPKGPIGEAIAALANGLEGKGDQLNTTLTNVSDALTAVSEGRGDIFAVVRSVAMFINTLRQNDRQLVELNGNLAGFTNGLRNSDQELATALRQIDTLLIALRKFIGDNGSALSKTVNNLAQVSNTILQPEPRNGLETSLHVLPNTAANGASIYSPTHGSITAMLVSANFANPLQFMCSAVQAASRLGYQESAELCAQYLAPILDAIKHNYAPLGFSMFSGAATLPSQVAYSEERLRPPPGYKDTTVPGVWARDTLFSHGNHEPGWKIAPGMDGLALQPFTESMIEPDDLATLMGAPPPDPPPLPAEAQP